MQLTLKAILCCALLISSGWGFFGHQKINRLAVFTLPPEMIRFYKKNIEYLSEASVNPDKRRYAVPNEAPRHYLDVEDYGDSAWLILPKYWNQAIEKFGEDTLNSHGIVPWQIVRTFYQLREAFQLNDPARILRFSAELGHYVGDGNVPLHTTRNHNGQFTDQVGIHGFWESRLPELFFDSYDFYTGKASYLEDPQQAAWEAVRKAHAALDSVLVLEKILSETHSFSKFNYETKGKQTARVYSLPFSKLYHERLSGMVERQLRSSIRMTGNLWYTAWVDGGQPDLARWIVYKPTEEELQKRKQELEEWKAKTFGVKVRDHEN